MRKIILISFFFYLLFSCKNNIVKINEDYKTVEQILSKCNSNDTIPLLDFSNKKLKTLPDLSKFKVKKLDISNNNLDTLIMKNLPRYLVVLDASNNIIKNGFSFIYTTKKGYSISKNNISKDIREINLSNNKIEGIAFILYDVKLKRIDLSYNNLKRIEMNKQKINYLNISNNKNFSNIINFDPKSIDTIIRTKISNDLPLKLNKLEIQNLPDKN